MNGKGSTRRPSQVSDKQVAASWARVFGLRQMDDAERRRLWDKVGDEMAQWLSSGMPKARL